MNIITVILFVVALVLFVICTIGVPSPPRFNLMAAGLAFVVLAILATSVHAQTTPQDPANYLREQRAYDRMTRDERSESREWQYRNRAKQRAWCREWRERVARHPRLALPRECWR